MHISNINRSKSVEAGSVERAVKLHRKQMAATIMRKNNQLIVPITNFDKVKLANHIYLLIQTFEDTVMTQANPTDNLITMDQKQHVLA